MTEAHEDLLHVPYEEAHKPLRPFPLAHWRFRGDFIYTQDYPWFS